jgi:hypothetical protein
VVVSSAVRAERVVAEEAVVIEIVGDGMVEFRADPERKESAGHEETRCRRNR